MIRLLKQYIFWRKWKNRLNDNEFSNGMPSVIYAINPNSFEITRSNWDKQGVYFK